MCEGNEDRLEKMLEFRPIGRIVVNIQRSGVGCPQETENDLDHWAILITETIT
jgi:hypothetical protein